VHFRACSRHQAGCPRERASRRRVPRASAHTAIRELPSQSGAGQLAARTVEVPLTCWRRAASRRRPAREGRSAWPSPGGDSASRRPLAREHAPRHGSVCGAARPRGNVTSRQEIAPGKNACVGQKLGPTMQPPLDRISFRGLDQDRLRVLWTAREPAASVIIVEAQVCGTLPKRARAPDSMAARRACALWVVALGLWGSGEVTAFTVAPSAGRLAPMLGTTSLRSRGAAAARLRCVQLRCRRCPRRRRLAGPRVDTGQARPGEAALWVNPLSEVAQSEDSWVSLQRR
jgi:hypothetical protein